MPKALQRPEVSKGCFLESLKYKKTPPRKKKPFESLQDEVIPVALTPVFVLNLSRLKHVAYGKNSQGGHPRMVLWGGWEMSFLGVLVVLGLVGCLFFGGVGCFGFSFLGRPPRG